MRFMNIGTGVIAAACHSEKIAGDVEALAGEEGGTIWGEILL